MVVADQFVIYKMGKKKIISRLITFDSLKKKNSITRLHVQI